MSMHTTELKDQKQLPNPTLINAFGKAPSDDYSSNKLVVFTAFKREQFSSQEECASKNSFSDSWFPTIFFYDLKNDKVDWEIFGAELFINIDGRHKVTVLTNEIYTEIGAKEYQQIVEEEDFSRHDDYDSYI